LKKIPVVILNGFLGSGKTTLFKSLLSQCISKNIVVCAIVNDMSELDVDGELISNILEGDNSQIFYSISSCILSSKKGIAKLNQSIVNSFKNNPELIIIETSGSCHPMPLIKYFKGNEKVKLTGVFVLLDSQMITQDFNHGKNLIPEMQQNMISNIRGPINLLVEQILFSSHIILTKTDKINSNILQEIHNQVKQINPYAIINSVVYGNLSVKFLFDINEYNYFNVAKLFDELQPTLDYEAEIDKPYNLASNVIKDDRPFHPERLWQVCHEFLDKKIYRSKGFFWLASRRSHSLLWSQAASGINLELIGTWRASILEDEENNLLPEELKSLKEVISNQKGRFGDRRCDLTVIGDKDHVNHFTEKLKSCFLTDEEIGKWKDGDSFKDPWPKKIIRLKSNQ
tara:strand:+ start:276 stop:1472 length:1197 start_codon:yes stop_codon:yes gene_type:complete